MSNSPIVTSEMTEKIKLILTTLIDLVVEGVNRISGKKNPTNTAIEEKNKSSLDVKKSLEDIPLQKTKECPVCGREAILGYYSTAKDNSFEFTICDVCGYI